MSRERESRPRSQRCRPPVNYHQSDDDDDYTDAHDTDDDDYDPHDDEDTDDYELAVLRAKQARNITKCARYRAEHREKVVAYKKKYRETHGEFLAETQRLYRETRGTRVAAASKRYRARHPDHVAAASKRYRERNRARLVEYQKRYRERNRARLVKAQKRYRENKLERRLAYEQQYRETHRDLLREKESRRRARLVEKKRTAEKLNALGPLTLTIPLTDYLKSGHTPVTRYVQAFCDSLESADTNVSPTESFVQLLEGDSHTVTDLDSGTMEVVETPEWDNLSFLQDLWKDMSPDDWQQVMNDVEDFDVEALLPPEDLVHDISSDEGIDLLFDIVT